MAVDKLIKKTDLPNLNLHSLLNGGKTHFTAIEAECVLSSFDTNGSKSFWICSAKLKAIQLIVVAISINNIMILVIT